MRWLMVGLALWSGNLLALSLEGRGDQEQFIKSPSAQFIVEGVARDVKTQQPLYIEKHFRDDRLHFVDYFDPSGRLIVRSRQDFKYSTYLPELSQHDSRLEINSGIYYQDDMWQVYKQNKNRPLPKSSLLVAGAGFDQLIKDRWDALLNKQALDFLFVVPDSLTAVSLNLIQIACDSTAITLSLDNHTCFSVKPSSTFLGFFLEPIEVAYENAQKRLVVFRGLTNLHDINGNTYKAEIVYRYR